MNKELCKAIMEKSRLRNVHLKYPCRENFLTYKNIKNKRNNLLKQSKKKYIKDISNKGAATSKSFWNPVKSFFTHKGIQINEKDNYWGREKWTNRGLHEKINIRTKDLIKDEKIPVEMLNKNYVNIVEKTAGIAPKNIWNLLDQKLNEITIREIIENYRNNPNIIKIKEIVKEKPIFDFPEATTKDIKILLSH